MDWDDPTEEQIQALLKLRGGCRCAACGCAPCSACEDPITEEEMGAVASAIDARKAGPHACERVDVGFLRVIWACKHCGRDM